MNGDGQSDSPVVPAKPANKAAPAAAESVEERGLAKGNAESAARSGHGAGTRAPGALDRVRQVAEQDKEVRFTALLHHVNVESLRAAYWRLRRQAAPGEDGVRWADYGRDLEANLQDLHDRIHRGAYRPRPSRRVFIPKADGRQRPLGIATTEDKIVQSAVVEVLNAIYEADFLGFSYGFRPGRKPHDALDALATGILRKKVNWVLDADIRDFFTSLDHGWLEKFLRAPDRGQAGPATDPEVAQGRGHRGGELGGERGGDTAGGDGLAAARERVPALRLRPVGRAMEASAGERRHDRRALRGRFRRGLRASS
jgi:hypothetical protein